MQFITVWAIAAVLLFAQEVRAQSATNINALRVGFKSHEARAIRRTSSMTDAA
jgi:hypothetical protein